VRRLAAVLYVRRRAVLVLALVALPLAGVLAAGAIDKLTVGGFQDSSTESARAKAFVEDDLDSGNPEIVVVATVRDGTIDDPAAVEAGVALTEQLGALEGVHQAFSYWTIPGAAPLASRDADRALVLVDLEPGSDKDHHEVAAAIADRFNADGPALSTRVGGEAEVERQATEQAEKDLARAETITIPLTFVALAVVFGGVVAALLPVSLGVAAIVLTLAVLNVIASITDVSVFALNLTTALGLGLAIDYSLFIVSRLREERAAGHEPRAALTRTLQTAGRTIAFSAGTVAISLAALYLFPTPYLRSFAYAGSAVVLIAAATSLVVLPALLAALGDRIDAWPILRRRRVAVEGEGFWHRQALRVMRRAWPVTILLSLALLALALPFLGLRTGQVDDRVLPEGLTSRQALEAIRDDFESRESSALVAAAPGTTAAADAAAIDAYAVALSQLPGVARVDAATGVYFPTEAIRYADLPDGVAAEVAGPLAGRFLAERGTYLSVVPAVEPFSEEGEALAEAVRDVEPGFAVLVGGPSAELIDNKETVASRLPLALGFIALTTFVLLFMMTGSLLVPLKALVLNMLSLTATFGAMVWIFQEGHLAGVLDVTTTGFIDTSTPLLMFCIAFGLSMDYEVFVLSRIKEEYDLTGDNTRAVAVGLQKTGRIVTAAAALLAIVFLGIATSSVSVVKMLGIGMTLAVLVDAFLIRATLVPALMQLAGRANWWAPRWLRRFHLRYGIFEAEPISLLDLDDDEEQAEPGEVPIEPAPAGGD
jgi:RND superfamily putative drug exporter